MTDTQSEPAVIAVPESASLPSPELLSSEELTQITQMSVLQKLASERMPEPVRSFIDCDGADAGLLANEQAWNRWALRPRVLVDVSVCDTTTTVLGREVDIPILVAPFTCSSLCHPDGEVAIAQGAAAQGTLMTLSARAARSPEEIQASGSRFWFHMDYKLTKKPEIARAVIERAQTTGAEALCLTVDLPLFPPLWSPEMMSAHLGALDYVPYSEGMTGTMGGHGKRDFEKMRTVSRGRVTWADIEWLKGETDLPIVLKGIQTAEDTELACSVGVAGVIVSNHGGHASAETLGTIDILPEVVAAAKGRCDVFVDGGIRSGADVIRGLALGATAVMIGRAPLWGITLGGAAGVARAIGLLAEQFRVEMAITGARSIAEINRSMIVLRGGFVSPA